MKRKTVYRLKLDRVTNTYRAEALRGGTVSQQQYTALRKKYVMIAEGMLNA